MLKPNHPILSSSRLGEALSPKWDDMSPKPNILRLSKKLEQNQWSCLY